MSAQQQSAVRQRLVVALIVTLGFVALEVIGAIVANSLALVTDAVHNLSDALALGLTWWALRLAARPANHNRTYGYHRAGILVALLNAATLIALSLFIVFEALRRLGAPPEVREEMIIAIGGLGLVINAAIAWSLHPASRTDVSVRSSFIHIAGDAFSTLGVILAGVGVALFKLTFLDPLAAIFIAVLIVLSAWSIIRETIDILLEGTPRDVDIRALRQDMGRIRGVRGIHDLHVWSISSSLRALSAHVLTDDMTIAEGARVQREINELLVKGYGIGHAALQLECPGCEPDVLYCELIPPAPGKRNLEGANLVHEKDRTMT